MEGNTHIDLQCKNCGQFISADDAFCKYCGCPIEKKEEQKPADAKRLKEIEDEMARSKTEITEAEFATAKYFDIDKLEFVHAGKLDSMRMKTILLLIGYLALTLVSLIAAWVMLEIEISGNQDVRYIVLWIAVFAAITFFALAFDRFFQLRNLKKLASAQGIVIIKQNLAKTPQVHLGEDVYNIKLKDDACAYCDTEIKGNLHIEVIEEKIVAVCNYNRKHFFIIAKQELFARLHETAKTGAKHAKHASR